MSTTTIKKTLPGSGKKSGCAPSLAVVLAVVALVVFCYTFFQNPGMFGVKASAHQSNPSLATALNAGQPAVFGPPALTAKQANSVLCSYHSSACGTGQAIYTGSLKSGVDDAFLMGVFFAESKDGTLGVAPSTHSVGNFTKNGQYIVYPTWQASYSDLYARVKSAGENSVQATLDYLYIPGTVNPLTLKQERAVEPSLQLVVSVMRQYGTGK
jgi:hypothetical protein